MPHDSFRHHCTEIARRFLLTTVVVDDEPSVSPGPSVREGLTEPGLGSAGDEPQSENGDQHPPRPLRVAPISWGFARQGMVCGVVSPQGGRDSHRTLADATARADIVVLDWRLDRETDENALPLLERILTEDRAPRLRLIAFYTGESNHDAIRDKIVDRLRRLDSTEPTASTDDEHDGSIDFGPCRIVVYAKPGSFGVVPSSVIEEEDLAERLIGDFAGMVDGLLPGLVLTGLAAVRENVHRVLERFGPDLDPAFLAHRACLPQPADSEQHMVDQIASELHGIMEDAVSVGSPAGMGAIEQWLVDRFGNGQVEFAQGKEMPQEDVLGMLTHGVEKERGQLRKDGKDYTVLSHGFSQGAENSRDLDRRLASAMSFRQVLASSDRQLYMGTIVHRLDDNETLLCVVPKCDSVRLTEKSAFLFLPLTNPKANTPQVVVPTPTSEHRRITIDMDPTHWCMADFDPDSGRQCVLARRDGCVRSWTFTDIDEREYRWLGELKPEFAQSIAHAIAARMGRVPLDKSEWLRRSERVAQR